MNVEDLQEFWPPTDRWPEGPKIGLVDMMSRYDPEYRKWSKRAFRENPSWAKFTSAAAMTQDEDFVVYAAADAYATFKLFQWQQLVRVSPK